VTVDEVRAFALALPEATEEPHFDMASFRVRGKIFCTVPPGDDRIHVFVEEDEIRALAAADPAVFGQRRVLRRGARAARRRQGARLR
jgi:hypothetical protein